MINRHDYEGLALSIAMTESIDNQLKQHLDKGPFQEDLTFALWSPSRGNSRFTAILHELVLPEDKERILQGNVAFTPEYVQRVLRAADGKFGIALLHSHLGPGWQGMSHDDIVAEKCFLASAVAGRTQLPLIGLTSGTDGTWSGRFWLREEQNEYSCNWTSTIRVVGQQLRISYHPDLMPAPDSNNTQVATVSVWGEQKQGDIARTHVGIVGLGSVGSIVAESLSRIGIKKITMIDHDIIEPRNLDRTLGATFQDAKNKVPKVEVSKRLVETSHTAEHFNVIANQESILDFPTVQKALDCDVIFSCVDRPWPRHILNTLAYSHLIPVVDGGILARVDSKGRLLHADWRIHTIGPERPCMVCLGALKREDISMDMNGLLDDPSYIEGLGLEVELTLARQNIFPFSLSVAAHEVLQFIGLVTGEKKIGGIGPQFYHCYPGKMEISSIDRCEPNCEYSALVSKASDLSLNCR